MRWVNEGQTVYLRRYSLPHFAGEVFTRYKVLVSAGNMARIEYAGEPDGVEREPRWVDVEDLVSEEDVAADAAARLAQPEPLLMPWDGKVPKL